METLKLRELIKQKFKIPDDAIVYRQYGKEGICEEITVPKEVFMEILKLMTKPVAVVEIVKLPEGMKITPEPLQILKR